MEYRVLGLRTEILFRGDHFKDFEAFRRPAVGCDDLLQFAARLRQCDVDDAFSQTDAFQQELESQSGFSCAWVAFDEIQMSLGQATAQDVVESGNSSLNSL